jgi:hypothetical protein
MTLLDLSDDGASALIKELHDTVHDDRYPLSWHIRTLKALLAKLRPEPICEPLPAPKVYALAPSSPNQKAAGIVSTRADAGP